MAEATAVVADTTATNNYKDTIVVAYPPGGYGTFVEWCLTYFTGQLPAGEQSWPFVASTGSAHGFRGNQFQPGLQNINMYLDDPNTTNMFARTHAEFEDMQEFITDYHKSFNRIVYIRPNPNTLLLVLNNIIDKAHNSGIARSSRRHVKQGMDTWEIRESISFWFNDYQQYMNSFYSVNDHCVIVDLPDLIANLESTLDKIFSATGLQWSHPHKEHIDAVTKKWLSLQKHLNKDTVCQSIVNSTIDSTCYNWADQNLTIYDEAFVQWTLRDLHGSDIRCYNVNVFPTNTTDLRNLLINE